MKTIDLCQYKELFSVYTELRVQNNSELNITFVNGNIVKNSQSSTSGVSARAYLNGAWGFASHAEISDETIKKVIKEATDNAKFLDTKVNKRKGPLPSRPASIEKDFSTKKSRLTQKELIHFLKEIDEMISRKYPKIASRKIFLNTLNIEKYLLTSDGSYLKAMIPRSNIYISLSLIKNGEPVTITDAYGGRGQFEDVFSSPSDFEEKIDELYRHLVNKSEGVLPEPGIKTCIIDADIAGVLAHEAIGHTVEADLVLGGSVAYGKIGEQVASPLISIIDFANTCFDETCPVPVFIDDEGTEAKDAILIENGVLKSYMHNKESAQYFGVEPTGNARAYLFSDEPLIRMRNTAILPGNDTLEKMIESIDDGYYLVKASNGQADTTSEFMFGVTLGYEIKNGKLGRAIKDTTISGVAFDVLKTVTMVSNEIKWISSGWCGKKQPMPVGMAGPAIKCQINIGGR
ncbi:peptidase [Caldanaerobacter subterraneus subsp. yonseiensis KB-1]|uniref:Peptidase n=1 Tax=Caldanaerobacter subterraneus subsp. yonseiensis KB-1 TaxID=1388761 RepID=U5CVH0_CALSX|nr:TldD/PmbA family protein [Caldanaerobacter subterraneus]ERM92956.1 peptidase [Caldanaerobacter subterraneus subsp. yonseiensis KB-1]